MVTKHAQGTTPEAVRSTGATFRAIPSAQQRLDQELTYLERWKAAVAPVERDAYAAGAGALAYARTALISAFLLNGGAMVVLPLFVQLGGGTASAGSGSLLLAMAAFAVGLLLSGCSAVCGYFAQMADTQRLHYVRESRVINLSQEHQPAADNAQISQQLTAVGSQANRWFGRKRVWQSNAVDAVLLALLAFASGTYFGIRALMG